MDNGSLKKEIEDLEIKLQRLNNKARKSIKFIKITCIILLLACINMIIWPPTPLTPKWIWLPMGIGMIICMVAVTYFTFRGIFAACDSMSLRNKIDNLKKIKIIKADENTTIKELFETIERLQ